MFKNKGSKEEQYYSNPEKYDHKELQVFSHSTGKYIKNAIKSIAYIGNLHQM